ncbi:hypothetical protein Tco_1476144 [Tanacetum coccineum]
MSSATSDVTYTSVYTDSEPGRAFWGADYEGIPEGGIPRVIVLGYDGLPLQPVAPPSPDFILGPENPQTPPVPQEEDEREPLFIQAHDPNYVPEPIYPEYIPLEDDHEFPAEEQPLPPIDSPTAESPGYITESDPEEDPEGYEDDEAEDGPVDYPMDGGDDGDDDDGDSSRDDARDEDEDEEDEEDEEEEEHLAPADSTTIIPADEPVFPPEGTEPIVPPPSTDITIGARITIRPQTSISLPPEAEDTTTQALIDAVTAHYHHLHYHHLYPYHHLLIERDDIPESEQPPRKRLHLSTIRSRYEIERVVVVELAELHERDTQDLYALLEDAQDSRPRISQRTNHGTYNQKRTKCSSQRHQPKQHNPRIHPSNDRPSSSAKHTNGDGSHSSHGDNRRNVQTARPCFYADFMKCQPLNFKGAEGVVGLTRWIEKMESVFNISGCAVENQVKFATCTLLKAA